jgi:hypothetical protein
MSYGSISLEAHTTLAIAMNRYGPSLGAHVCDVAWHTCLSMLTNCCAQQHRRQVQHGRGRRGPEPVHAPGQRRLVPVGDQAGGLGALRRVGVVLDECRRAADQDGPGRQARYSTCCRHCTRLFYSWWPGRNPSHPPIPPIQARAASCRATRSRRRLPAAATRPLAWG